MAESLDSSLSLESQAASQYDRSVCLFRQMLCNRLLISVLSLHFFMLARIPSYSIFWVLRISTYFSAKTQVFVVKLLSA